jgi:hypothetical protein
VADPVSEAVLLLVRRCLELRRSDPIALRRWRTTKDKFMLDCKEFYGRIDRTSLGNRAGELLNHDLAEMVADAIYGEPTLGQQIRLRRRIRKHFAAHRTYNGLEVRLRSAGRAILWAAGSVNKRLLHVPRPWNRRAPGGGCVAAMIGVDGSGKSTLVATIRAWLVQEVDVVPIYFGTGAGRPSLLLWPFKLMVPLATRLLKTRPKGGSHDGTSPRHPGLLYSGLLTVWATVVAVEKRIKLAAAVRGASRGLVVLTDRYPQDELLSFNESPLLARLTRVPAFLRRFEAGAYALAHRLPPDLVIKLVVTPETAARREPEMDPQIIQERIASLQRLQFPGARVVCVDAERPVAEVVRAVKREIWQLL